MIIAEYLSDMATDVLNGQLGIAFVFGLFLACPSSSYNSKFTQKKKPKESALQPLTRQRGKWHVTCFMNVFALKICTQLQLGGLFHAADIKYSLHMVYIEAGFSVNLRNHRNSSHHSWLQAFFIWAPLVESSQRVHTVKQGNMWRIAETKSHLWEYHKWTWEFH